MKWRYYIVFAMVLSLVACKKDTVIPPPDLGYNYYPGIIKSYIIYDVDSIVYRQVQGDTVKYKFQIKEVMDSLITDNENRPTIKLIRYRKNYNATIPYSQMSWTLQSVWVANRTNTDVEVVENNVRLTKLAFPVNLNATWNGTAHADSTEVDYTYHSVDLPMALNGNLFTKTATVVQKYTHSQLSYQNYYEQYARGVGLIYKHVEDYLYPNMVIDSGRIVGGTYYNMQLNSYGKE